MTETERASLLARINAVYDLRAAGDIDGMLAHLADDIVCFASTGWSHSHFPYTLYGKAAVRQALLERHVHYIALPSTIHRVLIDGDCAMVHRTTVVISRGGGDEQSFDVVDLFRFRDGLVAEFNEFPDGSARERINAFPR